MNRDARNRGKSDSLVFARQNDNVIINHLVFLNLSTHFNSQFIRQIRYYKQRARIVIVIPIVVIVDRFGIEVFFKLKFT